MEIIIPVHLNTDTKIILRHQTLLHVDGGTLFLFAKIEPVFFFKLTVVDTTGKAGLQFYLT